MSSRLTTLSPLAMEKLRAEAWAEAKRRVGGGNDRYRTFQATYRDNWVALIHDCIDWRGGDGPAPYQDEIVAELQEWHRMAVRGPHTLGKTACAAWIVLAFALTRDGDDWKVPTTASGWRHLTKFLWPEVHKWARRLRWDRVGREPFDERVELQTRSLKLSTGEAFALASNQSYLIEGAHATHLLYVFDEAKMIPVATWDAAEGAFAGAGADTAEEAFWLAISTPGPPQGRFHAIHTRKPGYEDWRTRHVSRDEAIAAGRMSAEWAEQRRRQWGERAAVYQNRVLGEFAESGEEVVVPLALVEAATELWHVWRDAGFPGRFRCIGVDVGRGGDPSVGAIRVDAVPLEGVDSGVRELRRVLAPDTMNVTGMAKGVLDRYGGYAVVDVIGVGAGVVDRLREQEKDARAFNAGERTDRRDASGELGFADKRSAAWWGLRERLAEGRTALPPDDEVAPGGQWSLVGELTAPSWDRTSAGRIKVESKKELRKPDRLGHSTDHADAVVQAYWEGETEFWSGAVSGDLSEGVTVSASGEATKVGGVASIKKR